MTSPKPAGCAGPAMTRCWPFSGAGVALYLAAWLLIPADGEDQSIAEAWIASRQDRVR